MILFNILIDLIVISSELGHLNFINRNENIISNTTNSGILIDKKWSYGPIGFCYSVLHWYGKLWLFISLLCFIVGNFVRILFKPEISLILPLLNEILFYSLLLLFPELLILLFLSQLFIFLLLFEVFIALLL